MGNVKYIIIGILIVVMVIVMVVIASNSKYEEVGSYGVHIGASGIDAINIPYYDEVVIDAMYFEKNEIQILHDKGMKVYSYMNLGSLENFRDYYTRFESITISDYENWDEERWIDVSKEKWKKFIIDELSYRLTDKNIDGFFVDNIDIYDVHNEDYNDKIYYAIIDILKELKLEHKKTVIINGGRSFVNRLMKEDIELKALFDGINLESVATKVDFENGELLERKKEEREEKIDFLKKVGKKEIVVYIIEYAKNKKIPNRIKDVYNKNGFRHYVIDNIELE